MGGFFDDISSGIGALVSPVQAGLNTVGLAAPQYNSILGGGLSGQLGLDNKFQAQLAPVTSSADPSSVSSAMGAVNQLAPQQADLATILRNQAMGQGVNPAQNMLNQATATNVANQAALQAGQRGASQNVGLIARNSANQGANIQQQAAGQAATLGAQQQLAAQGQLQQQQQLQQQGALTNQGQLLGAQGAFNNANVANYGNVNTTNAGVAAGNATRNASATGGLLNGLGSLLPMLGGAGGAAGGVGALAGGGESILPELAMVAYNGGQVPDHLSHASSVYYGGGKVPALVSPGEKYVNPAEAKKVANGEKSLSNTGEKIKGKASVQGDSLKNDTVHKNLDAGGVVIPRSVMQSDDPVKAGTKFLIDAMKKHKGHESDFKSALKKAAAGRKK